MIILSDIITKNRLIIEMITDMITDMSVNARSSSFFFALKNFMYLCTFIYRIDYGLQI